MKISVNSILILGACFVSLNSFATTNTEILKNLYDNGTAPAVAEDFPEKYYGSGEYVNPPANTCVIVDGTDQPYLYDISRTIRNTPAEGPLVPEKKQEKLVFGNSRTAYNLFQDPMVQGLDLVVTNPIYKVWVDGNDGVNHFVPGQLLARKSGQYIAFRIFIKHNATNVRDESYYGYCYPKTSLSLF